MFVHKHVLSSLDNLPFKYNIDSIDFLANFLTRLLESSSSATSPISTDS